MHVRYKVHSVAEEGVLASVKLGDREVTATVPGLTVELVSIDGPTHGHTFRFVPRDPADMQAHRDVFAPGKTVTATFEGEQT
jgi:hypothetical protein